MSYETLKELIEQGMSTYQIAIKLNCSQTNIRYWLRKHGLNTKKTHSPDTFCLMCSKRLEGNQLKFCSNECSCKQFYKDNKQEQNRKNNERQKLVSLDRKKTLVDLKGGKCKICGYDKNYSALCFHHRDPKEKTFKLDSRKLSNTNWASLLLEIDKCDLLCSNCHMELHNPERIL